jgi:hypothetical protein
MSAQRLLGNEVDIAVGINPVADLAAGANTGKRVHLRNYDMCTFLFFKNAASAGTDNVVLQLQEHTAATAGTSTNLAVIDEYYIKSTAAALAGTEAWTRVDNTSATLPQSTVTLTGAAQAANQLMVAFEVSAASLDAGYQWLSVNIADPGSGGTILGGLFYILGGLKIKRRADLLAQPNA